MADVNHSFFIDLTDTVFMRIGRQISPHSLKKSVNYPFKDHMQFPAMVDILSRKNKHHVSLITPFDNGLHDAFIEALLQYLLHDSIPYHLRGAELLQLNINSGSALTKTEQNKIEQDFRHLQEMLENSDKYLLILLTSPYGLLNDDFISQRLQSFLPHPKCRFIVLTSTHFSAPEQTFATLHLARLTETDILALLKQQRTELEQHHHVIIPEELLMQAYHFAERYLSANHVLNQALLLLDSSAARTNTSDKNNHDASPIKPVVTTNIMINVLSNWTKIPSTHLQLGKFKLAEFIDNMQQKIFGQDIAINMLGHELQQVHAQLQDKAGPFLSLLLAGPKHAGKTTTTITLIDQLFKQPNLLYLAQPTLAAANAIADIKIQRYTDKQYLPLKDVINHHPHAVILFENIEHASLSMLDGLYEILATGYLHDQAGNQLNFSQSIILLSTTLGSNRLIALNKMQDHELETQDGVDLMQLVMNEKKRAPQQYREALTPREIIREIMPEITSYLPSALCQHLHIIPFMPLNQTAIENILRLKLKILGRQLDVRYNIELGYAPEVIRFLTRDTLQKSISANQSADVDNTLKQLYICIEQAILSQADNKNRPNQLFLQLNETGQLLRCDWLTLSTIRQHTS